MPLDPLDALYILVEEDVGLLLVSNITFYKRCLEQLLARAGNVLLKNGSELNRKNLQRALALKLAVLPRTAFA